MTGMRKRLAVLVVALVTLLSMSGPALAAIYRGTNTINWPDKDFSVSVGLQLLPQIGTDGVRGIARWHDDGVDNMDHVYVYRFELWVERANGTVERMTGSPDDVRSYSASDVTIVTFEEGCLHEDEDPDGIQDGDRAWSTLEYKIFWNNGTSSVVRTDRSFRVLFDSFSDCTGN